MANCETRSSNIHPIHNVAIPGRARAPRAPFSLSWAEARTEILRDHHRFAPGDSWSKIRFQKRLVSGRSQKVGVAILTPSRRGDFVIDFAKIWNV